MVKDHGPPAPAYRILVAVDFSPASAAAIVAARRLADRTEGRVTLCHVRPVADLRAAVAEDRGDLLERGAAELRGALSEHYRTRLHALARTDRGEETRLRRGTAGIELAKEAARGYDVLVLGSRGRGAVAATLLGSTVQEMLQRSPVPVMVVPWA